MKKKTNLITSITAFAIMLIIVFAVFIFSDNEDLQEYVVKETLDTVTQIAEVQNEESTTEVIESTTEDEESLEADKVELTEPESLEEQGNISYNGDYVSDGFALGKYQGLTYYSQADSRWANVVYSSIGDVSQTIKSSGCGPTSAAMVVSSIKGTITPPQMADLFVSHGYRSANNGTYWSAYRWVADYFDIGYQEGTNVNTAIDLVRKGNYVIVSCGSGLFTYGGHYIVLVGIEGDTLQIFDPYIYTNKFETSTRRGKVNVKGNTVYCSVSNFKNYGSFKGYFAYKNNGNTTVVNTYTTNYNRYVKVNTSLNVRNAPGGKIVGRKYNGNVVTVYEVNGNWSRIGTNQWVSSSYLVSNHTSKRTIIGYRTGTYKTTSNIHIRSGAGTNYRAKTYKQLSNNARLQNKRLGNRYYNGYKKGVTCTVTKVKGNWGKTASGWICLSYCRKI